VQIQGVLHLVKKGSFTVNVEHITKLKQTRSSLYVILLCQMYYIRTWVPW